MSRWRSASPNITSSGSMSSFCRGIPIWRRPTRWARTCCPSSDELRPGARAPMQRPHWFPTILLRRLMRSQVRLRRRLAHSPSEVMTPHSSLPPPYLAVALDGVGWHPAAWRETDVDPRDVFGPRYWVGLIQEAEWAGLDFVTIEDSLLLQSTSAEHPEGRTDRVLGRLDAVLVAARVAPATARGGIIPVATTTHTEPFHVSKAIATLDYISRGRAGFQARISPTSLEAGPVGRRG